MAGWTALSSSQVRGQDENITESTSSRRPLAGKSVYLSHRLSSRSTYVKMVQSLGGSVGFDERRVDLYIGDPQYGAPDNALSYTYLEALSEGANPVKTEDYLLVPVDRIKATPSKNRRAGFTIEESKMIYEYMSEHERRKTGTSNVLHFKQLANAMPNHTWQSIQDHYTKRIRPRWSDPAHRKSVVTANDPSQRDLEQAQRKAVIAANQLHAQLNGNSGGNIRSSLQKQMKCDQRLGDPSRPREKKMSKVTFSDPVSSDLGPSSPVREDRDGMANAAVNSPKPGDDEEVSHQEQLEDEEPMLPSPQRKRLSELEAEHAPAKRLRVEKSGEAEVPNTPEMSPVKQESSHGEIDKREAVEESPAVIATPLSKRDLPFMESPKYSASAEKAARTLLNVSVLLSDNYPSSPPLPISQERPPNSSSHISTEPDIRRLSQIIERAVTERQTPPSSPPVPLPITEAHHLAKAQESLEQAERAATPESPLSSDSDLSPSPSPSKMEKDAAKSLSTILNLALANNSQREDNLDEEKKLEEEAESQLLSQMEFQFVVPDLAMPSPNFDMPDLPLAVPDPDIDMDDDDEQITESQLQSLQSLNGINKKLASSPKRTLDDRGYDQKQRQRKKDSRKDRDQSSSSTSEEADDEAAELESWIDRQVNKGSTEAKIVFCLKATSMDISLAKIALRYLKSEGSLPKDHPGIWTKEDDEALEGSSREALEALEKKHGSKYFEERMKFCGEYGKL